jgi:hypothetical protein
MLTFAVSLGVLGMPREGFSKDKDGFYMAFFTVSCSKYVEARRTHSDEEYEWWLAGYLTGLNNELPNTFNLVGSDDLSGPMLWLEDWCNKNPLKSMAEGAQAFVLELYPKRQQSRPK